MLLLVGLFSACGGNEEDYYRNPCSPSASERETQKVADIKTIKAYFRKNGVDTTNMQETASGIHYVVLTPGTGAQVKTGNRVEVHYIGKHLCDDLSSSSCTFDSSYGRGTTFPFTVGANQVIKGWDEALPLMQVGEEARFYIPSYLAYGPCGSGTSINGNENLVFDIKVISAK